MAYLFDDDQIKGLGFFIIAIFVILFVQISESTFTCNPQVCEVVNKNIFGLTIEKKKIKIDRIEKFEIREYYSYLEGSKYNRYRETIYAVPKYGQSYRFMGASKSSRYNSVQETVDKLNNLLPTTQDKIDVKIKF